MAMTPRKNDRNKKDAQAGQPPPQPDVEIWCGGLQWALREGYRKTDTLEGVKQEITLWLENLDELIKAFGPKGSVGEVLEKAGDPEEWDPDAEDDDED
jgi:hypothetical protein